MDDNVYRVIYFKSLLIQNQHQVEHDLLQCIIAPQTVILMEKFSPGLLFTWFFGHILVLRPTGQHLEQLNLFIQFELKKQSV